MLQLDTANGDVQTVHHTIGRRNSMIDLPEDVLNAVNVLMRVDQKLYILALQRFLGEFAWLELYLGHRVLCDFVLDQWDPELAYLNVSVTALFRNEKEHLNHYE